MNYRVDPTAITRLLPDPLRPKLHEGYAIAGICLIRLENIRPAGIPGFLGIKSENAAHRVAVEWPDSTGQWREGVFIPRRDTSSFLNAAAGGRVFPGEHHRAHFQVRDDGKEIDFAMDSEDGQTRVRLRGRDAEALPGSSCFGCLADSSRFFENGSLGYSATSDPNRMDGIRLQVETWQVRALQIDAVESSYFDDPATFPQGSAVFDHALVMRDIPHEWIGEADLQTVEKAVT